MSYIIVFRNGHRNPFVDIDDRGFLETYSSYEQAKEYAERIVEAQGPKDPHYFDYQIYEEATP